MPSLFNKGLNRDLKAAAEFLNALKNAAFQGGSAQGGSAPLNPRLQQQQPAKRPRGRPPNRPPPAALLRTLADAADVARGGHLDAADAGDADDAAGAGAGAGANATADPGFNCYGVYVTLNTLKAAFDARIAVEPEKSKGYWGRIADDVGIPSLDQCPTATGRSGAVHARYCKYFNHPFISAVGAK